MKITEKMIRGKRENEKEKKDDEDNNFEIIRKIKQFYPYYCTLSHVAARHNRYYVV